MKLIYFLIIPILCCVGCEPTITDDLLDGDIIFDPSLYDPESYLISKKYPTPSAEDLNKHILIAIHGYSASTFEWQEFQDWTDTNANYRVSQVLLGGHGRTYEDFKNASWRDWSSAIKAEYEALEQLGYKNISVIGSSTGAPLILELVNSGYFRSHIPPKNMFFIDPIVVSSIKVQSIAGIVGPMLGYVESDVDENTQKHWYKFRPFETVNELNALMQIVRKNLEDGIRLPQGSFAKTYHSKHDPVASSTSSVLIYKGLKTSGNGNIDVKIIDSDIHVFTRLAYRTDVNSKDYTNQANVFLELASYLN